VQLATADGSTLEPQSGFEPARLFLAHNAALEQLLFDRHLMGTPFRRACEMASAHFVSHFADEFAPLHAELAECVILSKGLAYDLRNAYTSVTGRNLPANFVATRRKKVTASQAQIEVAYANIDAPAESLIIGDTIASGATICAVVDECRKRFSLRRVFVFAIAGSGRGAKRIAHHCAALGLDTTIVLGLAAFGLADNGFDLSFLHPDTRARREYVERARVLYDGKPISSVGWDFGSQLFSPAKYLSLCAVEARLWELEGTDVLPAPPSGVDLMLIKQELAALPENVREKLGVDPQTLTLP
jgi:hypothetical protein